MQAIAIWMFLATISMAPTMAQAAAEAACGIDRYEPNDQRQRAKSTRGKTVEARVCGDDTDWYYVKLTAGTTVTVTARHGESARLALAFFPPRSRKPEGKLSQTPTSQTVRYRVTEDGKHRIRVRASGGAAVSYELDVTSGK